MHERTGASAPKAPLQRHHLKVDGLVSLFALGGDIRKSRLHVRYNGLGFGFLAHDHTQQTDVFIHLCNAVGVRANDLDAVLFQQIDLFLGMRHVAHNDDLRLKGENLLEIGILTGLHSGQFQHGSRIVAILAAANKRIFTAKRAEHFAVAGLQRNDAGHGFRQFNLAAKHVGDGLALGTSHSQAQRQQRSKQQGDEFLVHSDSSSFLIRKYIR